MGLADEEAIDESLMFRNTSIEQMLLSAHWHSICPFLACSYETSSSSSSSSPSACSTPLPQVRTGLVAPAGASLCDKGYFRCTREQLNDISTPYSRELLTRGAMRLMRFGYSPLFLLMFDETWQLSESISSFLQSVTGLHPIGDFYLFCVEPEMKNNNRSKDAFDNSYAPGPPHRDRPLAGIQSFTSRCSSKVSNEKMLYPKYASSWFALSDASTDNSCLCFVERKNDPGYYMEGDATREHDIKLSSVASKPLSAGGLISFSHRVLHWGSKLETTITEENIEPPPSELPRIALTTAFADNDFEEPYFDHSLYPAVSPPLGLRLGIVCGQQIQYSHMAGLSKHELALLNRIFHSQKVFFNSGYYEKICSSSQMQMFIHRQQGGKKH